MIVVIVGAVLYVAWRKLVLPRLPANLRPGAGEPVGSDRAGRSRAEPTTGPDGADCRDELPTRGHRHLECGTALRRSGSIGGRRAAELEEQGWSALWIPDVGGDLFGAVGNLLGATTVDHGGDRDPEPVDAPAGGDRRSATTRSSQEHGRRFLVGIGVSHAPLIDAVNAEAGHYRRPLARTAEYLDGLDAAPDPLPATDRVLAALGPKMLELARDRASGSHPYLVTPEHTAIVREALGAGPAGRARAGRRAVQTDPTRARELARAHLAGYLGLPNYANNWKRIGFTDDDIADGGSDRLVDALVAWGDEAAILARVQEHRDAGADHVCVQVLGRRPDVAPRSRSGVGWRRPCWADPGSTAAAQAPERGPHRSGHLDPVGQVRRRHRWAEGRGDRDGARPVRALQVLGLVDRVPARAPWPRPRSAGSASTSVRRRSEGEGGRPWSHVATTWSVMIRSARSCSAGSSTRRPRPRTTTQR